MLLMLLSCLHEKLTWRTCITRKRKDLLNALLALPLAASRSIYLAIAVSSHTTLGFVTACVFAVYWQ